MILVRGFAILKLAQSKGAVEYVDCTSVETKDIPNECPVYDTKQSDGGVLVMLELWKMQSTTSLRSLPVQLCPGVVEPNRVLSMGKIVLNCALKLN